jgi:hypothetical protein
MAYCKIGGFENGFQMISNDNEHLLEAINWAIIELNIQRAYNALRGQFFSSETRTAWYGPMQALEEAVYKGYPVMFEYFYSLEGYGKFQVFEKRGDGGQKIYRDYDKDNDGLKPFGLKHVLSDRSDLLRFVPNAGQEAQFSEELVLEKILKMPTKKVDLPFTGVGTRTDPLFASSSPDYTPRASQDPFSRNDLSTW